MCQSKRLVCVEGGSALITKDGWVRAGRLWALAGLGTVSGWDHTCVPRADPQCLRVAESLGGGPQASACRVPAAVVHCGERPQCQVSTGKRCVGRRRGHQAVTGARALESHRTQAPARSCDNAYEVSATSSSFRLSTQRFRQGRSRVTAACDMSQNCGLPRRASVCVKLTCADRDPLVRTASGERFRFPDSSGGHLASRPFRGRGRGRGRRDFPPSSQALLQWAAPPPLSLSHPLGKGGSSPLPPGSASPPCPPQPSCQDSKGRLRDTVWLEALGWGFLSKHLPGTQPEAASS